MGLQEQIAAIKESDGNTCVTVGTFDGVHKGHQALLKTLVETAQRNGIKSVALSFRQPPRSIIDPSHKTPHLYDAEKRVALIRELGIDTVHLIDFDDEIRTTSAADFLSTLQTSLGMTHLVIGEKALMGHDRRNTEQIAKIAQRNGFELHLVPPVTQSDYHVSSSSIRSALAIGDVKSAADMLGRLTNAGAKWSTAKLEREPWASQQPTCNGRQTLSCPQEASTPLGPSCQTAEPCLQVPTSATTRPSAETAQHSKSTSPTLTKIYMDNTSACSSSSSYVRTTRSTPSMPSKRKFRTTSNALTRSSTICLHQTDQ